MIPLPIEPYLIELLRRTAEARFSLVVAGGLGIYLKRRWVAQQIEEAGRRTLFEMVPLPDARATRDIDAFLKMDLFLLDAPVGVRRFRGILDDLAYRAHEPARYFQFIKTMADGSDREVKLDLHVRPAHTDEAPKIARKEGSVRVSKVGNAARRTVDAWHTPEAFAIDHGTQELLLAGPDPDGKEYQVSVTIPHPFASLCMKIAAAMDHERNPSNQSEKHAPDVYLLTAMMNGEELEQARDYAAQFDEHLELAKIRAAVSEIFVDPELPGCRTIENQQRSAIDLPRFCAVLKEIFLSSTA